jgi:hydroxyacylglutathione hydrolase
MSITIHQFPCLSDNYGFLVRDDTTGLAACIDTPDATAILRELDKTGWKLSLILNTHWHPDHAGGNAEIKAATSCTVVGPIEVERLSPVDRKVSGGDVVELGQTRFEVIESGGHTLGHIAYFDSSDHVAFVGDTLFALGCGRLFEGTAAQMWDSLQRLAALPDDTRVYCAHEYTASNARFAVSVDDDPALRARANELEQRNLELDRQLAARSASAQTQDQLLHEVLARIGQAEKQVGGKPLRSQPTVRK